MSLKCINSPPQLPPSIEGNFERATLPPCLYKVVSPIRVLAACARIHGGKSIAAGRCRSDLFGGGSYPRLPTLPGHSPTTPPGGEDGHLGLPGPPGHLGTWAPGPPGDPQVGGGRPVPPPGEQPPPHDTPGTARARALARGQGTSKTYCWKRFNILKTPVEHIIIRELTNKQTIVDKINNC